MKKEISQDALIVEKKLKCDSCLYSSSCMIRDDFLKNNWLQECVHGNSTEREFASSQKVYFSKN